MCNITAVAAAACTGLQVFSDVMLLMLNDESFVNGICFR
jgi:hypothetical protein